LGAFWQGRSFFNGSAIEFSAPHLMRERLVQGASKTAWLRLNS
jgi:hypothetical protein